MSGAPLPPDPPPAAPDHTPVAYSAVRAAAGRLLEQVGVTEPPTPVGALLGYCGVQSEYFALTDRYSDYHRPAPLAQARADLWPQVRGMIDAPAQIIYTHRMLHPMQERFVALHELGHFHLPWHGALLKTCSERDLSPTARAVWEREANLFAATCLFQGDGFAREAVRAAWGLAGLRRLARRWEASLEAAGRSYIESRPQAGALVLARLRPDMLDAGEVATGEPLLQIRYAVLSRAWRMALPGGGTIVPGALLPWAHPATRIVLAGGAGTLSAEITLPLATGENVAVQADMAGSWADVLLLVRPV